LDELGVGGFLKKKIFQVEDSLYLKGFKNQTQRY